MHEEKETKSCNQMAQLQLGKRARETFQVMHHVIPTMAKEHKLQGNYKLYSDKYHNKIDKIKKVEDLFIHHEGEINDTFEQLQTVGPPQDAWDNIAPGTEELQKTAQDEGVTDERHVAEEDIQAHINQIVNEQPQSKNDSLNLKYTKEARKELLTNQQYNKCMQHLNEEQRLIVMYHRKWCKESVIALKQNKPVKPHWFIPQWTQWCWKEPCCKTHTYRHNKITTMCTTNNSRGCSNTVDCSNGCSST